MIQTKLIKNGDKYNVKKVNTGKKKRIAHKDLFEEDYFRLAIIGKSGSGKTSVLYNILKNVIFEDARIVLLSSTLEEDLIKKKMIERLEKKGV